MDRTFSRNKSVATILCLLFGLFIRSTSSAAVEWPSLLVIYEEIPEDSSSLSFSSASTLYDLTLRTASDLMYQFQDSLGSREQHIEYQLLNDPQLSVRNQYLELPGEALRRSNRISDMRYGLAWRPRVDMNTRREGAGLDGVTSFGPALEISRYGVMGRAEAGLIARGWNSSLDSGILEAEFRDLRWDPGVFGKWQFGENGMSRLGDSPFWVGGDVYGEVVDTFTAASARGAVRMGLELESGDSMFVYYADSLTRGQLGTFAEFRDYSQDVRTSRSLMGMAAFRGKNRLHLDPFLVYSFSQNSDWYPEELELYRDRRGRTHAASLGVSSDSVWSISWSGGFGLRWIDEDKVFRTSLRGIGPNGELSDSTDREAVWADIRDSRGFEAFFNQHLEKFWFDRFGLRYDFAISRRSRRYPKMYLDGAEIEAGDDYNIISEEHRVTAIPFKGEHAEFSVYGYYGKNMSVYLKKARSADNTIDTTYRIGIDAEVGSEMELNAVGRLWMEVKRTQHQFPEIYKATVSERIPESPPGYFRKYTLEVEPSWNMREWLSFETGVRSVYWDDGYWNDPAYFDSIWAGFREEYKIQKKSFEYSVDMELGVQPIPFIEITGGFRFGDIYYRVFDGVSGDYMANDLLEGHKLEPRFGLRLLQGKLSILGRAKYTVHDLFNRVDGQYGDFWNVAVLIEAGI